MATELRPQTIGGPIVTDLGVGAKALRPNTPTVIVDHHVPSGMSGGATVISGYGVDPVPIEPPRVLVRGERRRGR